ncbi:MAG TPA: ABC transporter permease, partial [Streptosporangiaceae bacterium]
MIPLTRKLMVYVVTAWVAITVNFLLPRLMPGNPIQTMIGKLQGRVTPSMQRAIQLQFGVGLHQSLLTQYGNYWVQLFHGNLGQSITLSAPVSTVLGGTLPWTIGLLGAATVISFALGTLLGIALGWRRGSWLDGLLPVSTFFQAVPYFFLGTVLLLVFGSDLHWFPV